MIPIVSTLLLITTLFAGLVYLWFRPGRAYVFDSRPDVPVPFGRDMAWLAVRSTDQAAIVAALGLVAPRPANWKTGTSAIYEPALRASCVFVSPPVSGWTLVAGLPLPHPAPAPFVDKCRPIIELLGQKYGEVQYFANDDIVDMHAWARWSDGQLQRSYAVLDTQVVWDSGRPCRQERALGLSLYEIRGVEGRSGDIGGGLIVHPMAEHVLRLAETWSCDPTSLSSESHSQGAGVIAYAPRAWRVERMTEMPAAA
ncbi:MAG: hypothetical protein AAGC70_00650 [Pseudomonadota bacterium]